MTGGAVPTKGDDTLIVASGYDRRYFYSAATVVRQYDGGAEYKVYRLDREASDTLTRELKRGVNLGKHDPHTGKWLKSTQEALRTIVQNCTGIRRT